MQYVINFLKILYIGIVKFELMKNSLTFTKFLWQVICIFILVNCRKKF